MPQPMPPQGAPGPQPPNAGPGSPPDAQGSAGGGGILNLLNSIDKAIDHVTDVVSQANDAPPQAKQLINMVDQTFGKFMDVIQGGGGQPDADDSSAQGQTVPPEAAGNKGAIPSPM